MAIDETDLYLYGEDADMTSKNNTASSTKNGEGDLYDSVLTERSENRTESSDASTSKTATAPSPAASTVSISSGGHLRARYGERRYSIYFGNMTWWTTDQDVSDLVSSAGMNDLIEVKFYENRANGQSKGFCLVSFASEASAKQATEKLQHKEIHGQKLVILPYSKQSLQQFEQATKRSEPPSRERGRDSSGQGRAPGTNFIGTVRLVPGPPSAGGGQQHSVSVAQTMGAPPPGVHFPPGRPPVMPPTIIASRPQMTGMIPPGMPGRPMLPPPPGMGLPPPPGLSVMPPPTLTSALPLRPGIPSVATFGALSRPPPGIPPAIPGAPAPHINPTFYQRQPIPASASSTASTPSAPGSVQSIPQLVQASGVSMASSVQPGGAAMIGQVEQISEAEFEEIMNRNKTVSSSAISRAVSDASAGDYAAAIETLVTAISLIRQSRVAHDDRCKILIASLNDTLHGIETKSYGRTEKHRSRDRSRSRDRESRRERKRRERSPRSRSRSRERYARRQEMVEMEEIAPVQPRSSRHRY